MRPPEDLDLTPHPDRVTEDYADQRIREKIEFYNDDRPKVGLQNVNDALRENGLPAAYRLHYITYVAHLGRKAHSSLDDRVFRAEKAHRDREQAAGHRSSR